MASSDSERHTEEAAENKSNKQLKDRKFSWAKLHRVDSLNLEAGKVSNSAARHGSKADWRTILSLAFQSVGVIYGDIGTSPLYVYASTFTDKIGHKDDILGVLSLIIYTIILVPMTKYVFIVLWANDNGDGGAFALYSLVCRYAKVSLIPNQEPEDRELSHYNLEIPSNQFSRAQKIKHNLEKSKFAKIFLVFVAILGTSMVIGDGVLTPCISVLSAVSGIKPLGQEAVVGISIAILIALFCAQRLGTDKVGYTFAPAICIWFLFISGIGLYNLFKYDVSVLRAFNPKYIIDYFKRNGTKGWMSLGGVFLCITGSEAMFADLGHFSVRSIQISFSCLVFPALLSAYSGQAAYLSKFPEDVENTFYASIPDPLYWPTFVVAVAAAIIASQAMISGTFSIVAQAQGLGCFPRVKVIHTSAKYEGQVYIPELNYFLMIACVLVTLSFKTTEKLGHAYGIAVVIAEIITTNMVTLVMLVIWKISIWWITLFYMVYFSIESTYFSAQLTKFTQGGYLPLAFSVVLVIIMGTWHYAQKLRYQFELNNKVSSEYVRDLANNPDIKRVPGIGLLYSELVQGIPPIFPHFVSNIPSVHSVIVLVSIKSIPISKVALQERFLFRHVEPREYNVFRCVVRLGYKDQLGDTEDFENQLVEQLNEFIRHEHYILAADQQVITDGGIVPPVSGQLVAGKSSRVHMEEDSQRQVDSRVSSTGSIRSMNTPAAQSNRSSSRIQTVSPNLEEEDMQFVKKAKGQGVFYLLGEAEVVAKQDASFLKKAFVNYGYNFLRKNFRQGDKAMAIPQARLLRVGMTYEL
ncbi:PREDICTED: potassium transporter 5-like [Nicotiana attenuata]|uniref:Potassium transporter n=1 Tax=Nicotiana attenuata TaxID=49451 RepID=A0A1J6J3V8_NICAT|nr:PREDICTED: potassium transporter 5-like [Nicotiana attenuata]OIT05619.1 potassium transporter 5 [Nicotiana attenuata]